MAKKSNVENTDYKGLLDATLRGIDSGKKFVKAVSKNKAAQNNEAIQLMVASMHKRIDKYEKEAGQLWDLLQKSLKKRT